MFTADSPRDAGRGTELPCGGGHFRPDRGDLPSSPVTAQSGGPPPQDTWCVVESRPDLDARFQPVWSFSPDPLRSGRDTAARGSCSADSSTIFSRSGVVCSYLVFLLRRLRGSAWLSRRSRLRRALRWCARGPT